MKYKHRALLYNFICFAAIFILARAALHYFLPGYNFWTAVISAVIAMVLAPKFIVVKTASGEKLFVKWLFSSPKEIK
ncbi:hypothetical protein [Sinomicrobium weinanense]|uniref:Uncharacterized protein n=1 Tax=Sinomicrobium weinanense TaxID=2842200 RepID=A0A926JTA9_9FLAO|nr:hypothetical protein [Sinomicrobium weinanense]MBC9796857.1 hypothetical protein [Sinomicrobium weinanense]MBU3125230.1 hypothetical protein [Sinomicrobium weinanense]